MNLGKAIKLCRAGADIGQKALGERIGVSVSYISLLENNKRDPPFSVLLAIAGALGVPLCVMIFLASGPADLKGIPESLRDQLSLAAYRCVRLERNSLASTLTARSVYVEGFEAALKALTSGPLPSTVNPYTDELRKTLYAKGFLEGVKTRSDAVKW